MNGRDATTVPRRCEAPIHTASRMKKTKASYGLGLAQLPKPVIAQVKGTTTKSADADHRSHGRATSSAAKTRSTPDTTSVQQRDGPSSIVMAASVVVPAPRTAKPAATRAAATRGSVRPQRGPRLLMAAPSTAPTQF